MANDIKNKIKNSKLVQSVKSGLNKLKENVKQFEAKTANAIKFPGGDVFEIATTATTDVIGELPTPYNFSLQPPTMDSTLNLNPASGTPNMNLSLDAVSLGITPIDTQSLSILQNIQSRLEKGIF